MDLYFFRNPVLWNLHELETLHSCLQLSYFVMDSIIFFRIGSWEIGSSNGTFENGVTAENSIFCNQTAASYGMTRRMQNAKSQISI